MARAQVDIRDKSKNLRRLEAQRNELNAKGTLMNVTYRFSLHSRHRLPLSHVSLDLIALSRMDCIIDMLVAEVCLCSAHAEG